VSKGVKISGSVATLSPAQWNCHQQNMQTGFRNFPDGKSSLSLKIAVGEKYSGISTDYAALVGANSFAHNSLSVRMNSHLPTHQLRVLGSFARAAGQVRTYSHLRAD
jgi:hypothetical protein